MVAAPETPTWGRTQNCSKEPRPDACKRHSSTVEDVGEEVGTVVGEDEVVAGNTTGVTEEIRTVLAPYESDEGLASPIGAHLAAGHP